MSKKLKSAAAACIVALLLFPAAAYTSGGESPGHGQEPASGTHSAGGHGEGHSKTLNWWKSDTATPPVGWLIIDFAVMACALYLLLRKPLSGFLAGRRSAMAQHIEQMKKLKDDVDARHAEIEAKLARIDRITSELFEGFAIRGAAEKKHLLESTERMVSAIEASTRQIIDREVTAAKSRIQAAVTDAASSIAEELLKKHLKPEDNERLIREFVEKLAEIRTEQVQ
jgi:F-type H+-transporting ATPase subunit b